MVPSLEVLQKGHEDCVHINHCDIPWPLSPAPSTPLTMKTPDLQSLGPATSLVESEETPENTEEAPDAPEPAAEGDIQL